MAPYGRDAGMTQDQARRLAERVRAHTAGIGIAVEAEGRYFVVTVQAPTGAHTLRDEADWTWLRREVLGLA